MTHVGASKSRYYGTSMAVGYELFLAQHEEMWDWVGILVPKLGGIFFKVKMMTESLFGTCYSMKEPLRCDK